MDSLLKEISIKVDSKLDFKLKTLNTENKELFLAGKYEHFRSEEVNRQNNNLKSEVTLLEHIIEEQKLNSQIEQKNLLETQKIQFQKFKDQISIRECEYKNVERQLKNTLQNEIVLHKKIEELKLEIEKNFSPRKVEILEKENLELIKSLNESKEIIVKKDLAYRRHQVSCPRIKRNLETKIRKLKKNVEKIKNRSKKENKKLKKEKEEIDKLTMKKKLELETEKLNAKLKLNEAHENLGKEISVQVAKVQKYKKKYKDCQTQVEKKEKEIKEKLEIIENLRDELSHLNLQNSEERRKKTLLYNRVQKIDEIIEANKKWKSICEKHQRQVAILKKQLVKSEGKRKEIETKINNDDNGEKLKDLQRKLEESKIENESSRRSKDRLKDEVEDLKKSFKEQKNTVDEEKQEKEDLKKQIETLKVKNKQLVEENELLSRQTEETAEKQSNSSRTSIERQASDVNSNSDMKTRSSDAMVSITNSDSRVSDVNSNDNVRATSNNALVSITDSDATMNGKASQDDVTIELTNQSIEEKQLVESVEYKNENFINDSNEGTEEEDEISNDFLNNCNVNFLLPSIINEEENGIEENRDETNKVSQENSGTSHSSTKMSETNSGASLLSRTTSEANSGTSLSSNKMNEANSGTSISSGKMSETNSGTSLLSRTMSDTNSGIPLSARKSSSKKEDAIHLSSKNHAKKPPQENDKNTVEDEQKENIPWYFKTPKYISSMLDGVNNKGKDIKEQQYTDESDSDSNKDEENMIQDEVIDEFKEIAVRLRAEREEKEAPIKNYAINNQHPQLEQPGQVPFDLSQLTPEDVEQLLQLPPEEIAHIMQLSHEELGYIMQLHPRDVYNMINLPPENTAHEMHYPPQDVGHHMQLNPEIAAQKMYYPPQNNDRPMQSHQRNLSRSKQLPQENVGMLSRPPVNRRHRNGGLEDSSKGQFPEDRKDHKQQNQSNKMLNRTNMNSRPASISLSNAPSLAPLSKPGNNKSKQRSVSLTGAPSLAPTNMSPKNKTTAKLSSLSGAPSLMSGRRKNL